MCFYFHTDSEIVKLVIQMRRLRVRNIKKFVQGHSVDLAPELWTLGSQNQIFYMIPLRNLYLRIHNGCKMQMPGFQTRGFLRKWSFYFKLSLHVVAIHTGFKTEGNRLEEQVKIHPGQHSVDWERRPD